MRNHSHGTALLFLYCAGNLSETEAGLAEVQSFVDQLSGVNGEVLQDTQTGVMAVTLPGYSLDAAHYQALLLKRSARPFGASRSAYYACRAYGSAISADVEADGGSDQAQHLFGYSYIYAGGSRQRSKPHSHRGSRCHGEGVLQIRLAMQGYETLEAVDGLEALDLIPKWEPDLVLTELNLHGIDGLPFIHHIQRWI